MLQNQNCEPGERKFLQVLSYKITKEASLKFYNVIAEYQTVKRLHNSKNTAACTTNIFLHKMLIRINKETWKIQTKLS